MLSRLILAPDCRCLWELSRWCSPFYRRRHRDYRRLYGRQNQYRDYAHRGCVLCLPPSCWRLRCRERWGGIGNAPLSLTLVFVPQVARIAESVTARVRHMDYIDAARATGASALTIIRVRVGQRARADLRLPPG